MSGRIGNPYVGPRTFSADEGDRFFGREHEARDLLALVVSKRLVLFYAQSGAGKSSLIRTRLIPRLTENEGFIALPVGRVKGDLPPGIEEVDNIFLFNLYLSLVGEGQSDPSRFVGTDELTLTKFLANLTTIDGVNYYYEDTPADEEDAAEFKAPPHVLIIDQFEDIIVTHRDRWEDREGFFDQLGKAMVADPRLWVVLALREDSIAALDPYAHLVPGHMRSRFYMQRLEKAAALDAIRKPAELAGRSFAPGIADELVDDLRQIRVHGIESPGPGQYIEPVQLQVVCYQLWENLKDRPGETITDQDLEHAGDIDTSMADFYEQAIGSVLHKTTESELALRNWFEKELITEAGTRDSTFRGDEKSGGIDTRAADALVEEFVLRTENRAGGIWFELVHDRFVEPVLQANQSWRQTQQQDAMHLGEMLQMALLEEGELAQDILVMMASPGIGTWVSSDELLLESLRPVLAEHGQDALQSKVGLSMVLAAVPEESKGTDPLEALTLELRELVRPYSIEDVRDVLERLVQYTVVIELWVEVLSPSTTGELPRALERLLHAGVLIRRSSADRPEYAFANQVVAEEARALSQKRDWRGYRYEEELERTWTAWLARGALATRGQLRFLGEESTHAALQPVVALLLLRSAVAKDQPIRPWLAHLQTEEGHRLLQQVDDLHVDSVGPTMPWAQEQASMLLGLEHTLAPDLPDHSDVAAGQIARSAVLHPDKDVRLAAALALTVLERHPESVLAEALESAGYRGLRRRRRLIPLWSMLVDVDRKANERLRGARLWDRIDVWCWQFRRQILRDRMYIVGLTLGGAMGAGLGVGLLQGTLAAVFPPYALPYASHVSIYFFWGAVLGAAVSCGMALAKPLLLTRSTHEVAVSITTAEVGRTRLVANVALLLGSLFFGLAYLAIALLNGLHLVEGYPWALATGLGCILGLGLNLALYAQPQAGLSLGFGRWLLRLSTAALFFAISQFLSLSTWNAGLAITWSGTAPTVDWIEVLSSYGSTLGRVTDWSIAAYQIAAIAEASLVAIVLTLGLTFGLVLSARWVARWRELADGLTD